MKVLKFLLKAVGVVVALVAVFIVYVIISGGPKMPDSSTAKLPAPAPGQREATTEVAPGVQLTYREAGQGTPVLLIHGTGADADCWFDTFAALAKTHRVIAYDRRGYSRSRSAPLPETAGYFHQQGEDAAKLLDALKIPAATVIGWSAGGLVAMDLAIHHPDKVTALALMEPPYRITDHVTPGMAVTFAKIGILSKTRGAEAAAATFFRWATGRTDGQSTIDQLPDAGRHAMLGNAKTTLAELDAHESYGNDQVKAIKQPALLMTGALSQPNFHEAARSIKALLPNTTMVDLPNASHFMQFDAQAAFIQAVTEFVEKVSPTPPAAPPANAVANAPAPAAVAAPHK